MTAYSDTWLLLCAEAPLLVDTAKKGITVCNHFFISQLSLISHGMSQPSVHLWLVEQMNTSKASNGGQAATDSKQHLKHSSPDSLLLMMQQLR